MARTPLKQISTPIDKLITKIDLSALVSSEQDDFRTWLTRSVNMQTTVETALRKGHLVKACSTAHGKQIDYLIQIVDSAE